MKNYNNRIIIGIDHGYGNIKTANCCFKTGVTVYDKEPTFKENLLIWNDKYYLIGEEHKEFAADNATFWIANYTCGIIVASLFMKEGTSYATQKRIRKAR